MDGSQLKHAREQKTLHERYAQRIRNVDIDIVKINR